MEINGNLSFFVSMRGGHKFYEGSIARKNQDGSYSHAKIDLEFDKKNFPADKLDKVVENFCYTMEVKSGFLSVSTFKNKEGKTSSKVILHIVDAKVTKKTPVTPVKKDEDTPF